MNPQRISKQIAKVLKGRNLKYKYKLPKKTLITFLTIISLSIVLSAQNHNLSVINGYGSGNYQYGDTIDIWSVAYDNTMTFLQWTGDVQYLKSSNEWHTILVMPNHDISVTSVLLNMPSYTINYEQIMGLNNLKNVYSCFPINLKGVIYLFHGTGGNASNWINTVEYRSFVNASIADSFGIIVTEAEEITLNTDINGDGKLRWIGFPIDTINGVDYLNIKAITDTFINRGNISYNTPKFSVGMSAGGSFSSIMSYIYNYKAGISYCASSVQGIFNVRNSPFAFRMANYDDNPEVGEQGNYEAWQYDSILNGREICHDYEIHDKQPIYPERFARITGVSITTSQAIFNELFSNNQIGNGNYALHSDSIKSHILANPSLYPNIIAQSGSVQNKLLNQIATSNSEHSFYSDYNFETLNFLNNLCSQTVGINDIYIEKYKIEIYPNPTNTQIKLILPEGKYCISIFNSLGQKVLNLSGKSGLLKIDVSDFSNGLYIIQAAEKNKILTSKFAKQ